MKKLFLITLLLNTTALGETNLQSTQFSINQEPCLLKTPHQTLYETICTTQGQWFDMYHTNTKITHGKLALAFTTESWNDNEPTAYFIEKLGSTNEFPKSDSINNKPAYRYFLSADKHKVNRQQSSKKAKWTCFAQKDDKFHYCRPFLSIDSVTDSKKP